MKTGEWAIWNDEGIIEDDFWSREEAEKALADRYPEDDEAWVEEKEFEDEDEEEQDEEEEE